MKTTIAVLMFCAAAHAEPRYVTLTVRGSSAVPTPETVQQTLAVLPYETVEIVGFTTDGGGWLKTEKNGLVAEINTLNFGNTVPSACALGIVSGPARITLTAVSGVTFCTFKILPGSYPPDRSILLPPSTNGPPVRVTLQCSTNLVDWAEATNGVYGNLSAAKFFRIAAEPQ